MFPARQNFVGLYVWCLYQDTAYEEMGDLRHVPLHFVECRLLIYEHGRLAARTATGGQKQGDRLALFGTMYKRRRRIGRAHPGCDETDQVDSISLPVTRSIQQAQYPGS